MYSTRIYLVFILIVTLISCQNKVPAQESPSELTEKIEIKEEKTFKVGAERISDIREIVAGKKVGIVANQTTMVKNTHLVDTLISEGVEIVKIFSPEHGFRGDADAGESVKSDVDAKTGVSVVSLYGNNKKPTSAQLKGIDVILFDLQDVGVRFYTYISTMHYVMEAAAENNIKVVVLDRPNPNGNYVDGPIRKEGFKSFVGVHPIPVVHGMTIGEIAQMINGEKWLDKGIQCDLTVVSCENYTHDMVYSLPVPPSPNLRTDEAIMLYPSLCFFEGTVVSVGRGTETPFEIFGHPDLKGKNEYSYTFKPVSSFGAKQPLLENQLCFGLNLHDYFKGNRPQQLELGWLIDAYHAYGSKPTFFLKNNFIDLLAGTDELRKQIIAGKTETEIRQSWQKDLEDFRKIRSKYLIYAE